MSDTFFTEKLRDGTKHKVISLNYLDLINLDADTADVTLKLLKKKISASDSVLDDIEDLLIDKNWRYHIVACVASLIVKPNKRIISLFWDEFDRGSWVNPQIAVTLFLIDNNFIDNAKKRILSSSEISYCKTKEQWQAAGITAPKSKKGLAALLQLCMSIPSELMWCEHQLESPEIEVMLNDQFGKYGKLSLAWLNKIKALLQIE